MTRWLHFAPGPGPVPAPGHLRGRTDFKLINSIGGFVHSIITILLLFAYPVLLSLDSSAIVPPTVASWALFTYISRQHPRDIPVLFSLVIILVQLAIDFEQRSSR